MRSGKHHDVMVTGLSRTGFCVHTRYLMFHEHHHPSHSVSHLGCNMSTCRLHVQPQKEGLQGRGGEAKREPAGPASNSRWNFVKVVARNMGTIACTSLANPSGFLLHPRRTRDGCGWGERRWGEDGKLHKSERNISQIPLRWCCC